jgi:hypothetical protein
MAKRQSNSKTKECSRCERREPHRMFTARGKSQVRGCCRKCESAAAANRYAADPLRHERNSWGRMHERCEKPDAPAYCKYGGRGIHVCARWASFKNFLADMGSRPSSDHSVDRIDNNGDYTPNNCRWATRLEQAANTRQNRILEHRGLKLHLSEWSRRTGIPARCKRQNKQDG